MAMVELLRPWKHYKQAFILRGVTEGVANILVRRKIGRIIEPEVDLPAEPHVVAQQTNQHQGKKRGR